MTTTTTVSSTSQHLYINPALQQPSNEITCICIGTGRFLRSVLVPPLNAAFTDCSTLLVQSRGQSFRKYLCERNSGDYEVDTVHYDGSVSTDLVSVAGAGSLGSDESRAEFLSFLAKHRPPIRVVGIGVTEAGLTDPESRCLKDLIDILRVIHGYRSHDDDNNNKICVINTDNVPMNGSFIRDRVLSILSENSSADDFNQFVVEKVAFLNTMVDRITSSREGSNGLVPRCEPIPSKALVIEDLESALPDNLCNNQYGLVVRKEKGQLDMDIALKLRVANGTHTALAQLMTLSFLMNTDVLSNEDPSSHGSYLMNKYTDRLFDSQIKLAAETRFDSTDVQLVYDDWRKRLMHSAFGLSTLFITQNGSAKIGIRLGPTIIDLVQSNQKVTVGMAFAIAVLLRFVNPTACSIDSSLNYSSGVYRGKFDSTSLAVSSFSEDTAIYADGMTYNLREGWYEFKCSCNIRETGSLVCNLSKALLDLKLARQPQAYTDIIKAYLLSGEGADLGSLLGSAIGKEFLESFAHAISSLLARMTAGEEALNVLKDLESKFELDHQVVIDHNSSELDNSFLHYRPNCIHDTSKLMEVPVHRSELESVIRAEVANVEVVDVHTHLLPPSHGSLCLWGIDELLTYHYLVSEYFMTATGNVSPDSFYSLSKTEQADCIWKALFIDRNPISEACRGVITSLQVLGMGAFVQARDLEGIRRFYHKYRIRGEEGGEEYCETVFQKAGVRYNVMTNIPFSGAESQYWRPQRKQYSKRFRSALRIDPLLAGDKVTVMKALRSTGYDLNLDGLRQYLLDWVETMKPEYMMASTPHNFSLSENEIELASKQSINTDAMKTPFAFVDNIVDDCTSCEVGGLPSIIDENNNDFLKILMMVCEEKDLPLAIKIGAHRKVNPQLRDAGDGVVFADAEVLARLCRTFPKVRFLATFLSRNNQHEACVLALKFRNLHIYGCWWYCNNPSIIKEITQMRVEMLGTSFTAQHSDARVIDQLIYKWSHSRSVIANVLIDQYSKLLDSGWVMSRSALRCDIRKLFGQSYEDFMNKSLKVD